MVWLHAVIGTAFAFFVPGFALMAVLFPEFYDLRPLARCVLSVGFSIVLVAFVAFGLATVRLLHATALWLVVLGIVALLVILAYRQGFRVPLPSKKALSGLHWQQFMVPLAILVTYFAHLYNYVINPIYYPRVSSWRYIADAMEVIAARGFPTHSVQWDIPMPFVNNKVVFYLFSAAWLELTSLTDLVAPAMQWLSLLILGFALLSAALFLTQLVPPPFAALGLVLLFWTNYYNDKFVGYTGEGFGISMLFVILWIVHCILFLQDRRLLLLSPFIFATLVISHGVVGMVGIFLVSAIFLARLLAWSVSWRLLGQAMYLFGIAGALCLIMVLSLGEGSFTGSTSVLKQSKYQPYYGHDPTIALNYILSGVKKIPPPIRYKSEQVLYTSVSDLAISLAERSRMPVFGRMRIYGQWSLWAEISVFLAVAIYVILRGDSVYRTYVVAFAVFFSFLFIWGMAFSIIYETWLPATHPIRREFLFGLTANLLLLTMALASLFASKSKIQTALAVGISLLILGWYIYFQMVPTFNANLTRSSMLQAGYNALLWLRDNTEPEARILTNVRTTGAFKLIANRHSLTEGRTTYLNPTLLTHSLDTIDGIKAFLLSPNESDFIDEHSVDYVVITKSHLEFGGHNFIKNEQNDLALESADRLEPLILFGDTVIYKVN